MPLIADNGVTERGFMIIYNCFIFLGTRDLFIIETLRDTSSSTAREYFSSTAQPALSDRHESQYHKKPSSVLSHILSFFGKEAILCFIRLSFESQAHRCQKNPTPTKEIVHLS